MCNTNFKSLNFSPLPVALNMDSYVGFFFDIESNKKYAVCLELGKYYGRILSLPFAILET